MHILMSGLVLFIFCFSTEAAGLSDNSPVSGLAPGELLLLADSSGDNKSEPESGSLVIPGEDQGKEKKQCLNVCKKWGEDCIINPRTGSRSCRRTCKQFGEECF